MGLDKLVREGVGGYFLLHLKKQKKQNKIVFSLNRRKEDLQLVTRKYLQVCVSQQELLQLKQALTTSVMLTEWTFPYVSHR